MKNSKIFELAYLSIASYADLSEAVKKTDQEREDATKKEIEKYSDYSSSDTSKFGEIVTNNYKALAHWQDRGDPMNWRDLPLIADNRNTSGFSATLFQHKESKEYVLAFRGTKGAKDLVLVDGGDVVLNGIAHGQLVDLYNFWVQMNTAKNEIYQAAYYREVTKFDPEYYSDRSFTLDGITLGDSNRYIVDFKPSNELYAEDSGYTHGLGVLSEGNNKVSITGHSLGGHLAILFSQIFSPVVNEAFIFNGAGLGRDTLLLDPLSNRNNQKILDSLSAKHGMPRGNKEIVTSIIGDKGIDFVANDWLIGLKQAHSRFENFIEEASSSDNIWGHGMDQMAETMALAGIFASLDEKLDTMPIKEYFEDFLNPLLRATARDDAETLEAMLNKLSLLLIGHDPKIAVGDREAFYQTVTDLRETIAGKEGKEGLAGKLRINMANAAVENFALQDGSEGFAARYALKYLNPFIAINEALYTAEKLGVEQHAQLLLYNPADNNTIKGMTSDYIANRTRMLTLLNKQNSGEDISGTHGYQDLASSAEISNAYTDYSAGNNGIRKYKPWVIFGSDKGETIEIDGHHGNGQDVIFAGAGNDSLKGGKGDDHMEGGTGHDAYYVQDHDTILDTDGQGKLLFTGKATGEVASKFVLQNPQEKDAQKHLWQSVGIDDRVDGKFSAYRHDDALIIKENGTNNQATINHFFTLSDNGRKDFLGITLAEGEPSAAAQGKITYSGRQHQGNVYYLGTESFDITGGNRHDFIIARAAKATENEFALIARTGAGRDLVYGSFERDWIEGGDDVDVLNGSTFTPKHSDTRDEKAKALDKDTIFGGAQGDFINGMAGDDTLYGDDDKAHLLINKSDERGDWITGGEGNDQIYGSAGQDFLQGGEDTDVIHGGAHDDVILGDGFIRADIMFNQTSSGNDSGGGYVPPRPIYPGIGLPGIGNPGGGGYVPPGTTTHPTYEHTWRGENLWDVKGLNISRGLPESRATWTLEIERDKGDYRINHNGKVQNDGHLVTEGGTDDYLYGGRGNDLLIGQTGNDVLNGEEGNDILFGDDNRNPEIAGNDTLIGGIGDDTLYGGKGDDTLIGGAGADKLHGGEGADSYYFYRKDLFDKGMDTLEDLGKEDRIYLDNILINNMLWTQEGEGKRWHSGDWQLSLAGSTLTLSHGALEGKVGINNFENGLYGLTLTGLGETPKPEDPNPQDPKPEDPQNPKPPTSGAPLAVQSIDEKQALSFTVPDNAFQSGKDDPLSYSAQLADGKPLPAWLTFDSATRTFSGTPSNDDVGTLSIELSAKGKGGSASQRFTLNILNVNDAPQAGEALADVQAERGKLLTYALPANAFVDIDKDDTLTLSATLDNGDALPIWLNFDAEQARFAGTPPADAQAAYRIVLTATDNAGARIAQSFVLNIGNSQTNIIRDTGTGKILHGTAGNDTIYGNDHILPGGNYKEIHGLDGNDKIIPGKGRSMLYGDAGNDILYAHGEEHLMLNGGHGDDIYRIDRYFKSIWIKNSDLKYYDSRLNRFDIIELMAHQRSDFIFYRHGDNLYLTGKNGQEIRILDQFSNQGNNRHYIHEIRFADTTMTMADIKALLQNGTPGDDILYAKPEGETLYSGDGNDQIFGRRGNDRLYGENGNDFISGGMGDDQLIGENGDDVLYGGDGNDTLDGGYGNDRLHGHRGDDRLYGHFGDDQLYGGPGNDELHGLFGKDSLYGEDDDDLLFGYDGNDMLFGGSGNDKLDGGLGDDQLLGGIGNDDLFGGEGNDIINGGKGNDHLVGHLGNDIYQFQEDFGTDIILNKSDRNTLPGNQYDRIDFLDLTLADLVWQRSNNDLTITSKKYANNRITVLNHFLANGNTAARIDEIRFADGTKLDYDAINRLVQGAGNTTRGAFRRVDSTSVQQAQQMTQAMASFDSVQPLDALAVPEIRQPLLAGHNG